MLRVPEVLQVLDAMRCVLFCILEAVEGRLCLLEVMRCVQVLCMLCGFRNFPCGSLLVTVRQHPASFCEDASMPTIFNSTASVHL